MAPLLSELAAAERAAISLSYRRFCLNLA